MKLSQVAVRYTLGRPSAAEVQHQNEFVHYRPLTSMDDTTTPSHYHDCESQRTDQSWDYDIMVY